MSATVEHVADDLAPPSWTIGDYLWKARKLAGLDQKDIALAIGVSRPLVSKWERDQGVPNIQQLRSWAEACGAQWLWTVVARSRCFSLLDGPAGQMELAFSQAPELLAVG